MSFFSLNFDMENILVQSAFEENDSNFIIFHHNSVLQ